MMRRKPYEIRTYTDTATGVPLRIHAVVRRSESVHETLSFAEATAVCNTLNREFDRINDAEQEFEAKKRAFIQTLSDVSKVIDDAIMTA